MSQRHHPYMGRPEYQFWKSVANGVPISAFDPVVSSSFQIGAGDKIVTAGSCFAQHVARHLSQAGFTHHVTEKGHPIIAKTERDVFNYGVFSARYGNIYTARQLHQLLLRAYGAFKPVEDAWALPGGGVVDPFRPQIQPDGFLDAKELVADRAQHFAAVRKAVEELDVFIFTLGLTESWLDKRDGAVFPLAPGVVAGGFDDAKYEFHNMDVVETIADMNAAFAFIRERNPRARFVLTVSPVPLNATALPRHVVVSTAYSKAVLRVAAENICAGWEQADYFPSYEIITAPNVRGAYFGADGRSVTESGVEHVMGVFLKHYGSVEKTSPSAKGAADPAGDQHLAEMECIFKAICDEEAITDR